MSRATGIAASTIGRGLKELAGEAAVALGRVRRAVGRCKSLVVTGLDLLAALLALVVPDERGIRRRRYAGCARVCGSWQQT